MKKAILSGATLKPCPDQTPNPGDDMQNLPIGISSLSTIRNNDMVYVDKTELAWNMVRIPAPYFLSRPRRFGKTLFVDTLQQIFEGNEQLFNGLYIHDKWDWSRKYPVIRIDFAGGQLRSREELDERIFSILRSASERLGISCSQSTVVGRFEELIVSATRKFGLPAVVLVDEYDKPILDNIENSEVAGELREGLKNLYSVLKAQDRNLQFAFMTGVSKFSKVSLFSGLNQLHDITIDEKFSNVCGYTQEDLDVTFQDYLQEVDREKLRRWYNGYSWMGQERVYNPFDILLFISKGWTYRNYWFETGSPEFLIRLFRDKNYFLPDLDGIRVTEEILQSFEIDRINPVTLLFQSGYLTIDHALTYRERLMFVLRVPNQEVRIALHDQFVNAYTDLNEEKIRLQDGLYEALEAGNIPELVGTITRVFAAVPWRNFTNTGLSDFEGYYASVMYAFFASLNARIIPEDISSHGQVDMTVMLGGHIYVIEIKVTDDGAPEENPALHQIRERKYAQKYAGQSGKTVHEVGLIFSRKERNLVKADWGRLSG